MSNSVVLETLAHTRTEDVLLLVSGDRDASDADLERWLARLAVFDYKHLLIAACGEGGHSSKQRARIADFWKRSGRQAPRVAILTDSVVGRCVVTALSWVLGNPTRAFASQEHAAALTFLGSKVDPAAVAREISALHAGLRSGARRSA
jgi:hypothetical protein